MCQYHSGIQSNTQNLHIHEYTHNRAWKNAEYSKNQIVLVFSKLLFGWIASSLNMLLPAIYQWCVFKFQKVFFGIQF